jgi:hypothetical protein
MRVCLTCVLVCFLTGEAGICARTEAVCAAQRESPGPEARKHDGRPTVEEPASARRYQAGAVETDNRPEPGASYVYLCVRVCVFHVLAPCSVCCCMYVCLHTYTHIYVNM